MEYKYNDDDILHQEDDTLHQMLLNVSGTKKKNSNTLILNPFFVSMKGGNILEVENKKIYQNYKSAYIMCLKDDININEKRDELINILSKNIKKDDLKKTCSNFVLIKTNGSIIRNYQLKRRSNIISNDILNEYFPINENNKYELTEIIIPLYELKETEAKNYAQIYGTNANIKEIGNTIAMLSKYNRINTQMIDNKVMNMITSIDCTSYWSDNKNCNFNMDDVFNSRSLTYNGHRLDKIRFATIRGAKSLNNLLTQINKEGKNNDYHFNDISDKSTKNEHMTIYRVLKDMENRTFYASQDIGQFGYSKEDVADVFDMIVSEKYRFEMLNMMMTSKDLCHFVVNNKRVLERNKDLFEKYKPLYAYLMGYAWTTLYLEGSIFNTKSTRQHRYVFDIETANKLPVFPFSLTNVHNNPYITLLLNRDLIDPETNCMSINFLEKYEPYYGVCSKEEAIRRFNIFACGDSKKNVFEGIDNKIFSFSGSAMPACLMKRSPLMDRTGTLGDDSDKAFKQYFDGYYGEADIDMMCYTSSTAEFIGHGTKLLEILTKNLECQRTDIKIKPNKKMAVILTKHFFKECVDDLNYETKSEYKPNELIKLFEENLSDNNESYNTLPGHILEYFHNDYVTEKKRIIKKWKKSQEENKITFDSDLLDSYHQTVEPKEMNIKLVSYDLPEFALAKKDSEIYYFVNDFRDDEHKVPKDKNYLVMKYSESIKYKINTGDKTREIELFKIDTKDPFGTVARFHKPCVRAYYQDGTFYMLPSFITAMMTLINIEYKYFAGSRDPIEIINKYRNRLFSVILNTNEKKSMIMYDKLIDQNKDNNKEKSKSKFFGPQLLNSKMFKQNNKNWTEPSKLNSEPKYIKTCDDLKEYYLDNDKFTRMINNKLPYDIFEMTTIMKNGYIRPYDPYIARTYYNMINSSSQ